MSDEQKVFPRGAVAMGNGDLIDVTNIKFTLTNSAKLVHTIRQRNAGFTLGNEEANVTLDVVVGEDGLERDWIKLVKRGTVKQLRIKVPGSTFTLNGVFTNTDFELPTDGEITLSLGFIGKLEV